jgi:ABC-type Fe3+-siderophore transport system permease subunit
MKKFGKTLPANEFIISAALLGRLFLAGFLSVTCGTWPIRSQEAIKVALAKLELFQNSVPELETAIVWDGCLPRFIAGELVGFLLGSAGAILVIYSDLFVRLVVKVNLKIDILRSLLGGPFFIYLLIKDRKRFEYM